MNAPVVLTSVGKSYRFRPVVDDVTLQVDAGEICGMVGANGAGKTTLLRLIAGLARPSSGRVDLFGKNPRLHPNVLRQVGALIGSPGLYPFWSGAENLHRVRAMRALPRDEAVVADALDELGLAHAGSRAVRTYSTGMRQRLAIAAATIFSPQVVLLDEPTDAIDTDGIDVVAQHIAALRERDAAVVVVSHDHAFVTGVSDRIVKLSDGHLLDSQPNHPSPTDAPWPRAASATATGAPGREVP